VAIPRLVQLTPRPVQSRQVALSRQDATTTAGTRQGRAGSAPDQVSPEHRAIHATTLRSKQASALAGGGSQK